MGCHSAIATAIETGSNLARPREPRSEIALDSRWGSSLDSSSAIETGWRSENLTAKPTATMMDSCWAFQLGSVTETTTGTPLATSLG